MSKIFSRFSVLRKISKRKLVPTVAVLLIIAIGTPLLTRQFWVYDADLNTFTSSSGEAPASYGEISVAQMQKFAQLASTATKPPVQKIDMTSSDSDLQIGRTLYDQATFNHGVLTGKSINLKTGLLRPGSGKNDALGVLNGLGTQLNTFRETLATDTDKAKIQSVVDKVDSTVRTLVNSTDTTYDPLMIKDIGTLLQQQSQGASAKLQDKFNYSFNVIEPFAIGVTLTQTETANFQSHLTAETASTSFSNTVGQGISNSIQGGLVTNPANAQWNGLSFSRNQYDDFWTKGQALLDKVDENPTPEGVTKLKADIMDLARSSLGINSDLAVKFGLAESVAGTLLFDKKTAYDIWLNNAEMAQFKNYQMGLASYASNWSSNSGIDPINISFLVPKDGRKLIYDALYYKNNPEELRKALAEAGLTPEDVEKAATKFIKKYGAIEQVVNEPAANSTTTTAGTTQPIVSPVNPELATTSETAHYEDMTAILSTLTGLSRLEKDQALTLSHAVNQAINNNLNNSYFGQTYISWLNWRSTNNLIESYTSANAICSNSGDKAKIAQYAILEGLCGNVSTRLTGLLEDYKEYPGVVVDDKGKPTEKVKLTRTASLGTVSMDARTGAMVYNSAVVYFDKAGEPKIGGQLQFNPTTNEVSGDLTAAFGNNRVTLYSDALTGELYLEYSKLTTPIVKIGSIVSVHTITVAKDGAVGGSFTAFHKLMNYNPNTKQVEVAIIKKPEGSLWVGTDGTVRGTISKKVAGSVTVGLTIDSKGNFSIPINFASKGITYGSLFIGQDGKIAGQVDLGKIIGAGKPSVFIGFDSNGISSVGFPIGSFAGSPFSFSIGRDGGVSFGGFIPIGPVPVPIALGQDQRGNFTISWPGGHWNLGHEDRPVNAPAPKMKEDKSGYDGGLIYWHHGFKKLFKVVRIYNKVKILPAEQKSRGDLIFKKYNELLRRNPSISEFLNWYFYSGHECYDGARDDKMKSGEAGRNELLAMYMTSKLTKDPYSKVVPATAKFPNVEEYKWLQAGNKSEEFPKRPTDLITLNPFDPEVIAKAQAQLNKPSTIGDGTQSATGASIQQVTNAVNQGLQADTAYAATLKQIQEYFKPTPASSSTNSSSGFVTGQATTNSNLNTNK